MTWALLTLTACADKKTSLSEYPLLTEKNLSLEAACLQAETDGPFIYIVAGIHGDEPAGIAAAEEMKSALEIDMKRGSIIIVSPANPYGAEHGQRKTEEDRDLNRNFPGDSDGCDAERLAAGIFEDIERKQPDLVLDLHEAVPETEQEEGRDALGNSIICQSIEEDGDLVLSLLTELDNFTLYGSPPPGSLNKTVTEELGIPVITVETLRSEALQERQKKQRQVISFILNYYGMT